MQGSEIFAELEGRKIETYQREELMGEIAELLVRGGRDDQRRLRVIRPTLCAQTIRRGKPWLVVYVTKIKLTEERQH